MEQKVSIAVRVPEAVAAWLEKEKARRGVTTSYITREAISNFMEKHSTTSLEDEVSRRAGRRREIDLTTDKPKMLHDGVRFSQIIWESIEEEKEALALFRALDVNDYDYFRRIVAANREAVRQHESPEDITRWLDSIDEALEQEKKNIPSREILLKRHWAKQGMLWESGTLTPLSGRKRNAQR